MRIHVGPPREIVDEQQDVRHRVERRGPYLRQRAQRGHAAPGIMTQSQRVVGRDDHRPARDGVQAGNANETTAALDTADQYRTRVRRLRVSRHAHQAVDREPAAAMQIECLETRVLEASDRRRHEAGKAARS